MVGMYSARFDRFFQPISILQKYVVRSELSAAGLGRAAVGDDCCKICGRWSEYIR